MLRADFEKRYNVRLLRKDRSLTMKILGIFIPGFIQNFWTTYRLPFQKRVTVTYPPGVKNPMRHMETLEHELHHVLQFQPWYGPILMALAVTIFPLPILFSGRWFVERKAYLWDIKHGRYTTEEAAEILWSAYGWCWPKCLMIRWFNKHK